MRENEITPIDSGDEDSNVLIRGTAGILSKVVIATTSAHALTFYDATDTVTPTGKMLKLKASVIEGTYELEGVLENGLVVEVPADYAGEASICHRAG